MLSRVQALVLASLVLIACVATWQVQGWRFSQREAAYAVEKQRLAEALSTQLLQERQQRQALEQQVRAADQTHQQELTDARQTQARLRDRLATADLRLSVLLADGPDPIVSATSGAGGVVHDPPRARLDPAHAQRIVAITGDGDEGLIALRACQAYVRALVF